MIKASGIRKNEPQRGDIIIRCKKSDLKPQRGDILYQHGVPPFRLKTIDYQLTINFSLLRDSLDIRINDVNMCLF